jgi:hypothetical protein
MNPCLSASELEHHLFGRFGDEAWCTLRPRIYQKDATSCSSGSDIPVLQNGTVPIRYRYWTGTLEHSVIFGDRGANERYTGAPINALCWHLKTNFHCKFWLRTRRSMALNPIIVLCRYEEKQKYRYCRSFRLPVLPSQELNYNSSLFSKVNQMISF